MFADIRYAIRSLRRSPLFATSVIATIGLGLGVLCFGFVLLNTYVLKPIELPEPHQLYALSWDTSSVRRQPMRLTDFEALRNATPHFAQLAAVSQTTVMQDGSPMAGLLVTGNFFQLLGAQSSMGRPLIPADAPAPGQGTAVVLSNQAWRARYGADPAIVGKTIVLGRQRFDVVGVLPRNLVVPGFEGFAFYAPLTSASAFDVADPWNDTSAPSLRVIGRLNQDATESQARAWFDVWVHQRFPQGSESAATTVNVESRGTRLALSGAVLALFLMILSALAMVLLVACANVTNLVLARGFARQREIAVRLSLGANRGQVIRQLLIESLVLAVPAAALGLALATGVGRVFPEAIASTFPLRNLSLEGILVPLDPDLRVFAMLSMAAIVSSVLVALMPALHVTRANLVRASKGDEALDPRRSRLRTSLVGLQIGASVLFLVTAIGFIDQSRRMASPDRDRGYARVADVHMADRLRTPVMARLAADPAVEQIAAAWRPPMSGVLRQLDILASETRLQEAVGFAVVSPEYFPMFGIRLLGGRAFTAREAADSAPVAMVSRATAATLWPGIDPIGQRLDLVPNPRRVERLPTHRSVRVIGVVEDVVSGSLQDGLDPTCVYFATGFRDPGDLSLLVRARGDMVALKAAVTDAVNTIEKDAPFRFISIADTVGAQAWVFQAFSVAASILGGIGLLLAFSGTYAVVAFLVTQRTREFGIRMALGANVRHIVSGIMSETSRTAAIGLGGGIAVAVALSRLAGGAITIFPPLTPRPYLVGLTIVALATAAAALVPSLRTTRIDPSKALRVE